MSNTSLPIPSAPGARPQLAVLQTKGSAHPSPTPTPTIPQPLVPTSALSSPPTIPSDPSAPSLLSAGGSAPSLTPSQVAALLDRSNPLVRPGTPLGFPLPQRGPPTPSHARKTRLTLSTSSGMQSEEHEEAEYVDELSLSEFLQLAKNLGDDSIVTRLTSDDSRHPVIFLHFTHQGSPYYARIRRPYSLCTTFVRSLLSLDTPAAVLVSNTDLEERKRKKVKLLIYPWRAHYPTLDPSNPLQLPLLALTEEGGRLARLLNALGNGQTYGFKPPLRLRDVAQLAVAAQHLTPRVFPESFKHRFFAWHVLFSALGHFGHELFVTYRRSIHPDFVLGLRWDLKQYGPFASVSVALLVMFCTLLAYLPIFILLGFLFQSRSWSGGGVLYLLLALPAGVLSPLPDYLLRAWSARVENSNKRFRASLTAEIRRVYGGYAEVRSTQQWSMSGPVGNINMHSPLFPYLAVEDDPSLPDEASIPPMELKQFLHELKLRAGLSSCPVTAVQVRQGRGSPFLRSYLLFFINFRGQDMAIRVDPAAKKLTWWHPYEHSVFPSSVRITSVAADDAAEIIEDGGGSSEGSHILFTLNSWKTAFIDIDPKQPEQLISLASQSRAAHRRLTSLTDVPSRLADHPTPTLFDAIRAVQAAHDEFHPAYSAALFTLRASLAVLRAFSFAYSNEYLPSVGDSKRPVHPVLFNLDDQLLQHHRAMIRHLNMLITVLFYAMLIGLAFITPDSYERFMVANTTIIFAVMVCWFVWNRVFWPAWLGSTESGIDTMAQWLVAKILPKAVPLPRGSYSTMDGDKPSKPMNWDIPPAGVESGLEAAKADWAQRVSSRMASSGMAPSSRFPSSTGVPRSRDVSLESRRVEGSLQSVPQTRETSTERR